jgi:signal peptidase I
VDDTAPAPRPWWRRVTASLWFQVLAAFVVTGLILSFVAKPYWVPSGSMENTLVPGDRILVNRLAFVGATPATGDIIVFDADEAWDSAPAPSTDPVRGVLRWIGEVSGFGPSGARTLVKRVIAAPGQTVVCCDADGAIVVDGEPLVEPYVFNDFSFVPGTLDCDTSPASQRCFAEVVVPEESFLMLGDNRAGSSDSAIGCREPTASSDCWRWASSDAVVGKAVAILWPVSRWAAL